MIGLAQTAAIRLAGPGWRTSKRVRIIRMKGKACGMSHNEETPKRRTGDAVAVNGVFEGNRIWVEEEPWFLFGDRFPVRFEDGMLDWSRLSEAEREEVARVDAHMRGLYGIVDPPPRIPAPVPDVPCELGWLMPIDLCRALADRQGNVLEGWIEDRHEVVGERRFALEFASDGEIWLALRSDGLPWAASTHARYSRVPSVWVDVDMWRYEDGDFLEIGDEVERPQQTERGRLRTIYVERWPDEEARYGTRPGAGALREVLTPVKWSGEVWWKDPRWREGLFPMAEGEQRIDYRRLTPAQKKTEAATSACRNMMEFWDEPIDHFSRENCARWTEPIGTGVTLEDLRRHYESMGLESPY